MVKKAALVIFLCIIFPGHQNCTAQGVFFREHWAEFDAEISNSKGRMLRVNDAELSLHEVFGKRQEALANGFTLINVPEDLFGLQAAELYLEVWGGHPGTANKRVIVNGKQTRYRQRQTNLSARRRWNRRGKLRLLLSSDTTQSTASCKRPKCISVRM